MIVVTSNCLDKNIPKMYDLVIEILRGTQWSDLQHLKTVVSGSAMDMMNSLAQSGHSYAMQSASAKLSASQRLNEVFGGITQIQFMNQFAAADEEVLKTLSEKLKVIPVVFC